MLNALIFQSLLLQVVIPLSSSTPLTPPSKPTWPSSFAVNFQESFSDGTGASYEGLYALDMNYVDKATGIQGAEVILRGPTPEYSCNAVNPGTKCVTLAVGGQRYLQFEDGSPICCRCCSWANGCGPLAPAWTENATYIGEQIVRGEKCYDYNILGSSNNSLSVRASDGMVCALNNAGDDFFEFIPSTYKKTVSDTDLFQVPAGCDTWCGPHAVCKLGWNESVPQVQQKQRYQIMRARGIQRRLARNFSLKEVVVVSPGILNWFLILWPYRFIHMTCLCTHSWMYYMYCFDKYVMMSHVKM